MDGESLDVGDGVRIPITELVLRTSRSSGPGGQHANVTASRVEAVFEIGASAALTEPARERLLARFGPRVTAVAQEHRSQSRNRELALERLRERIAEALRPRPRRRPTRPTRAARERRLAEKRSQAERKEQRRPPDG